MNPGFPYFWRPFVVLFAWVLFCSARPAVAGGPYVGMSGGGTVNYNYEEEGWYLLSDGSYVPAYEKHGAVTGAAFAGVQLLSELALEVETGRSALNNDWELEWTGAYLLVGSTGMAALSGGGGYLKIGPVRTRSNIRGRVARDNKIAFGGGVTFPMNRWVRGRAEMTIMDFAGMPESTVVMLLHLGLVAAFR